MPALCIHTDAKKDLDELWDTDFTAAAKITVTLEELEGNSDLLDSLTDDHYGDDHTEDFSVCKWLEHWNNGRDLWRLKLWDLEDKGLRYRIIYAYIPRTQHYHVLAIAPREFNYDTKAPISKRILEAYEDL